MPVDERTGRAVGLRPTVLLPPGRMTLHEQGLDSLTILARLQVEIPDSPCEIGGGVEVSMSLEATDHATKGLLIGPIGPVGIMTPAALLRRIGALDTSCLYPSFSSIPFDLLGNVCQIRRAHVGVH